MTNVFVLNRPDLEKIEERKPVAELLKEEEERNERRKHLLRTIIRPRSPHASINGHREPKKRGRKPNPNKPQTLL